MRDIRAGQGAAFAAPLTIHLRFAVFFAVSVAASASSLSDWSVLAEARIEKSSQLRSTV